MDESLALMTEVETIKEKKKVLEDEYHALIPRHAVQQQKLRACEVCGAFLSMYDNDRRLADHFGGKLHIGFVTIRDKMKQLEVSFVPVFRYVVCWHLRQSEACWLLALLINQRKTCSVAKYVVEFHPQLPAVFICTSV